MPGKNKQRHELECYLQKVYREHIRLKISEQKMNNAVIRQLHSRLTQFLKKDPLFSKLYKKTFFGGSYYDGLKVSKPDEYDINLQMKVPIPIKIISGRLLGYAQMEVQSKDMKLVNNFKPLIGEDNYLSVSAVNSWFQGIVIKAVEQMQSKRTKRQTYEIIQVTQNGPAMTLLVENQRDEEISIDFVPSFWFDSEAWPENCIKQPLGMNYGFCVVPKTTKDDKTGNDLNFRLSFHEQERELIFNQYFLKPSVKLLKFLRDEETQTQLKSYYIKTVALWELKESGIFTRSTLSASFLHMLKRLQRFIDDGEIPFYWNPSGLNLICDFSPAYKENLSNRLARIIRNIEERNWPQIADYFNTPC